jgi:hypothetical protein
VRIKAGKQADEAQAELFEMFANDLKDAVLDLCDETRKAALFKTMPPQAQIACVMVGPLAAIVLMLKAISQNRDATAQRIDDQFDMIIDNLELARAKCKEHLQ